jgi:hypothetical protein
LQLIELELKFLSEYLWYLNKLYFILPNSITRINLIFIIQVYFAFFTCIIYLQGARHVGTLKENIHIFTFKADRLSFDLFPHHSMWNHMCRKI